MWSDTENEVLQLLLNGEIADLSKNEQRIDVSKASTWGSDRILSSDFLRHLCTATDVAKRIVRHGIRIRGAKIDEDISLAGVNVSFPVSFRECSLLGTLDLSHSQLKSLDLSGCITGNIDGDCLCVSGHIWMNRKFTSKGPVCLIGATVSGNVYCTSGHFDNSARDDLDTSVTRCADCRASMCVAYALILERTVINGSLYLCGGFTTNGGVSLCDSQIDGNVTCSVGSFAAKTPNSKLNKILSGRRLACETDAPYHQACAFNGEGMVVGGNLLMNAVKVTGETRLTGAVIAGNFEAKGIFENGHGYAIHGDRLRVRGNVYLTETFEANGAVRLPRAEIGADFSLCGGKVTTEDEDCVLFYGEGITVKGALMMKGARTSKGFIDISDSIIGGNVDCSDATFTNAGEYAVKADGIKVSGSMFFSSHLEQFEARGMVSLRGARVDLDVMCIDGHFFSNRPSNVDYAWAISAGSMSIGGQVRMGGASFKAVGGIILDYTKIGSFLSFDNGTIEALQLLSTEDFAISAGRLQAGGSVYLENANLIGRVMLNDAIIGRNLVCENATIVNEGCYSLIAMQMQVAGSVMMEKFTSEGEIRLCYGTIGGNLICSGAKFVNRTGLKCQDAFDEDRTKAFAFRADGTKIAGSARFNNGFQAIGVVCMQGSEIGRTFLWRDVFEAKQALLFLDSTKAGVLDDAENSWPDKDNLQINDFEYSFLKELNPQGLEARRLKWLKLPKEFRNQPYEHLANVLSKSGYDEEARKVLIEKNHHKRRLVPSLLYYLNRKPLSAAENDQRLPFLSWLKLHLLGVLVCYGYRPFRAVRYGLALVAIGWVAFYQGFENKVMVTTKTDTALNQTMKVVAPKDRPTDAGIYSLVYAADTFLPLVDFEAAGYWLPSSHANAEHQDLGTFLCFFRWFLISCGWIISTVFVAAVGGIVRK